MKLTNFSRLLFVAFVAMSIATSCVKEGPAGPAGPAGADGKDGVDANETCKMCHNPTSVDLIAVQFQFSKHEYGEAAFEEAGNTGCTPCHAQEAFKYVVKNNVVATFKKDETTGKYSNQYVTIPSAAYGEIGCSTCHSSIHATYGSSDMIFTTVAKVDMTMWGGSKSIDLKADGGVSNLCVKCHQPRPQTNALNGNYQDYESLFKNPKDIMYDGTPELPNTTDKARPSYRMHIHYGAIGAIYAGVGGVEFGSGYTNSKHTTEASCVDCHMGDMNGRAGGHTFKVRNSADGTGLTSSTAWNFNGCNVTGCHKDAPIDAKTTSKYWKQTRDEVSTLLSQLAAKLAFNGVEIMNKNKDASSNLWAGLTKNNYDGYLNVYDPVTNPGGIENNGTCFKFIPASKSSSTDDNGIPKSWTAEQKAINAALPEMPALTNAQYGAIINFQLCLREYSLGIHNTAYTKTLLTNSIAALQ
jgi:hypothetical protein